MCYLRLLTLEVAVRLEIVEHWRHEEIIALKVINLTRISSEIPYFAILLYNQHSKHLALLQYGKPIGMSKDIRFYPFHCKQGKRIRLIAEGVIHRLRRSDVGMQYMKCHLFHVLSIISEVHVALTDKCIVE